MRADAMERHRRLLDAGREIISERGADVPLAAVAQLAGVGIGTLYRHFPARTDFTSAVMADVLDRTLLELTAIHSAVAEYPCAALQLMTRSLVQLRLGTLIGRQLAHNASVPDNLQVQRNQVIKDIACALDNLKAAGEVRVDLTADEYLIIVGALTQTWHATHGKKTVDTTGSSFDRILDIFVAGTRPGRRTMGRSLPMP